jgi:hypothetical protein
VDQKLVGASGYSQSRHFWQRENSDARTRTHSESFAKQKNAFLGFSHEVLWSAMRLRIAFNISKGTVRVSISVQNPEYAIRNFRYPSLVCTTTSTRRFGLCSSIEPLGDARNFIAP